MRGAFYFLEENQMGIQVTTPDNEATKPSHVTATVLGAAPPAIAAGEAAIFCGNLLYARQTEVFARIQQCIDTARESDFMKRASAENVNSVVVSGHKGAVTVLTGATIAALTESDVAIMWDETFNAEGSTGLFVTTFERLRETLMELSLKTL